MGGAPADDAENVEPKDRPCLQPVAKVLPVFDPQLGDNAGMLPLVGLEQPPSALELREAQPMPVLVPVVHEDRRPRVSRQIPDPTETMGIGRGLRLVVEGREDDVGDGHETDGHRPRASVLRVNRGQDGATGLGKERTNLVGEPAFRASHSCSVDSPSMPEPTPQPTRHVSSTRIIAIRGGSLEVRADRVVAEEPLEIRVAGPHQDPVAVAVTMRTPGDEDELAVGFLRTEGLIAGPEVRGTRFGSPEALSAPDDTIIVRIDRQFDASRIAERHFVATASCGICGKASIDEVAVRVDPIPAGPVVARAVNLALPDKLRAAQHAFDATGGLHAAGLFTPDGTLVAVREDVGRHNALDKLVGSQVLARAMPLHDRILMVSGRVSFEIVQKAAAAGVPILCAVSAPSSLAIDAAERLGVTLIGFLRGDGFNVYSHDARIDLEDLREPGIRRSASARR
jgi:FdhD protein